ncbi:CPBP family intramembrane metalloprotease [candidate division KSB1 bacterium]|nr:CPBP family intramembrane metalloprotease [candidate division KSB1 bacterium]
MNGYLDRKKNQPAPWLYLFGVIVWSWFFLGLAALSGGPLFRFPTVIPALLGLLGPLILPAVLITRGYWDSALDRSAGAFFRRAFNPRTLSFRWFLIVAATVIVIAFLPVLLDRSALNEHGLIQVGPAFFLLIGFLAGAVEEPGWRGYAQEGLQRRMPVVVAALVIGIFWALWHLPLFFISGTYQAGLGVGTPAFWAFHSAILVGCPIYAWLYNGAGRVAFAAVLFHGLGNLVRELVPDVSNTAEVGVEAALALVVTALAWKGMSRRANRPVHSLDKQEDDK